MVSIADITPHPNNPRTHLGDLAELTESIKIKGLMQPPTVVPNPDGDTPYMTVIGHRRIEAAKLAGLDSVPCLVAEDMNFLEQIATMLLENIQRADLTPWEQAESFQFMMDLGETAKSIAEKTGFSPATVKRRLDIFKYGSKTIEKAAENGFTLMDFARLEKIKLKKDRENILKNRTPADIGWILQSQIRTERAERRIPDVTKTLDSFAKHNPGRNYHSYGIGSWAEWKRFSLTGDDAPVIPVPKDTDKAKYEYTWNHSKDEVKIFRKAPGSKKTADELRAEAARKEFSSQIKKIDAVAKQAYEARLAFAKDVAGKDALIKKHLEELIAGATLAFHIISFSIGGTLGELLGIDTEDNNYMRAEEVVSLAAEKGLTARQILFAQVYARFDDEQLLFHRENRYGNRIVPISDSDFPVTRSGAMKVYDFLSVFGYEMAEEERQYVEGTHWLYDEQQEIKFDEL
jgi:ParB family chromosome partitioning protein